MIGTLFLLLIAISFFVIGMICFIRRIKNRPYAEMLKANRRMNVSDFARKICTNEFNARKILVGILEDDPIDGYMDRRTEEFFTMEFLEQTHNVRYGWKCQSCGAKNESVIILGETGRCAYCNTPVGAIFGNGKH